VTADKPLVGIDADGYPMVVVDPIVYCGYGRIDVSKAVII
jgi:hypothetical protein